MKSGQAECPQLSSAKEAAAWLKISEPTVYRLLRSGALKGAKVGGQWRIPIAELQKYVEDQIKF